VRVCMYMYITMMIQASNKLSIYFFITGSQENYFQHFPY
jgi:hypothetical protein